MEVKMNKEIMGYREAMFFGLDFRQMVCSLLAVLAAVGIYFSLRDVAGDEVTGWLCMAGAALRRGDREKREEGIKTVRSQIAGKRTVGMHLIRTLNQAKKVDWEKLKVPRSVQQAIPILETAR